MAQPAERPRGHYAVQVKTMFHTARWLVTHLVAASSAKVCRAGHRLGTDCE